MTQSAIMHTTTLQLQQFQSAFQKKSGMRFCPMTQKNFCPPEKPLSFCHTPHHHACSTKKPQTISSKKFSESHFISQGEKEEILLAPCTPCSQGNDMHGTGWTSGRRAFCCRLPILQNKALWLSEIEAFATPCCPSRNQKRLRQRFAITSAIIKI